MERGRGAHRRDGAHTPRRDGVGVAVVHRDGASVTVCAADPGDPLAPGISSGVGRERRVAEVVDGSAPRRSRGVRRSRGGSAREGGAWPSTGSRRGPSRG